MAARLHDRPLIVLLMGLGAMAMFVPSAHALSVEDFATSRIFFYGFLLFLVLTLFIALATTGRKSVYGLRGQLISLFVALTVLPFMFALPFYEAVRDVTLIDAWFQMVADFTTTGAPLYDNPRELPRSVHLWRSIVGWLGGLLAWVSAMAVLAPLNLGGFEVYSAARRSDEEGTLTPTGVTLRPGERLAQAATHFVPIYTGLTLLLWLGLTIAGEVPFVAFCHALAVISTSGISPVGGIYFSAAGITGEIIIALFLMLALSHLTFTRFPGEDGRRAIYRDPELRLGLLLVLVLSGVLFLRHAIVAIDPDSADGIVIALRAFWGGFFTILSFVTTTGFESADWATTRRWSGLDTPGLMLLALCMIGGGVATTAGGVKLLRVYALYRHGQREVARLIHPSSVGGAGKAARRIRREGAQIAWTFFMIFAVSIAVVMLLLALTGVQFETAMVLAVAALSTTGPLAQIAAEAPISYSGIPQISRVILAFAMILGRLETLALIALLNPEFWRR